MGATTGEIQDRARALALLNRLVVAVEGIATTLKGDLTVQIMGDEVGPAIKVATVKVGE